MYALRLVSTCLYKFVFVLWVEISPYQTTELHCFPPNHDGVLEDCSTVLRGTGGLKKPTPNSPNMRKLHGRRHPAQLATARIETES